MSITLENAMIYIGIITFAAGLVRAILIAPLQKSIEQLQKAIEKMDENITRHGERITLVEASARSAHKRIDEVVR